MVVRSTDVVIVGAGAAGLACATRLRSAGVPFELVEAADRVGGRAQTDYQLAAGRPLELGAQLVHGSRAVTHQWTRQLDLHTERIHRRSMSFSISRKLASLPYGVLPFHPAFGTGALVDAVGLLRRLARYDGPDLSYGEFLSQREVSPPARVFLELVYRQSSGADADELGVMGLAEEYRASDQSHLPNFVLTEGYSELMQRRAVPMRERIHLLSRVTHVRWGSGKASVLVEEGEGPQVVEYQSRCVVITVPLSILKGGRIEFDPPLPDPKSRAIDTVSYGQAILVHLRLNAPFRLRRKKDVGALWGNTSSVFTWRGPVSTGASPSILSAFTTGGEAARRASLSDPEVVDATLAELRSILPEGVAVAEPESQTIRRWPRDPFIRGAYSYLGVGARLSDRSALAESVGDTLFFAGEATHDRGQAATVHGAIETGYRAAGEVLAALRRPPPG